MTETDKCVHHWVLGDVVEGPADKHAERGRLRHRESSCRHCGETRLQAERETNKISRVEWEGLA